MSNPDFSARRRARLDQQHARVETNLDQMLAAFTSMGIADLNGPERIHHVHNVLDANQHLDRDGAVVMAALAIARLLDPVRDRLDQIDPT